MTANTGLTSDMLGHMSSDLGGKPKQGQGDPRKVHRHRFDTYCYMIVRLVRLLFLRVLADLMVLLVHAQYSSAGPSAPITATEPNAL